VPTKEVADAIGFWANVGNLMALLLYVAALVYAVAQLRLARRAASAGSLIPLYESFRQAWLEFDMAANEQTKQHAFADVANLLELACAIDIDKLFVGETKGLLERYLIEIFTLIQNSPDAVTRMQRLVHTSGTFKSICAFLLKHKSQLKLELVLVEPTA
jgi:hypothetical protein